MLLTLFTADPIMYADQQTCEVAMLKLNTAYPENESICIPAGIQEVSKDPIELFEQMLNMVTEMNINLNNPQKWLTTTR